MTNLIAYGFTLKDTINSLDAQCQFILNKRIIQEFNNELSKTVGYIYEDYNQVKEVYWQSTIINSDKKIYCAWIHNRPIKLKYLKYKRY